MGTVSVKRYSDWITARNASCEYEPIWHRVGVVDGFAMIHVPAKQIVHLKVEETA